MSMSPEDKILLDLLDKGAVEFVGFDDNGEALYNFTEKLKDVNPDLYKLHTVMLNQEIMHLWEKGFVSMDLFEENPTVKLTKKAFSKSAVLELDEKMQEFLKELKRILKQR